MFIIQSRLFVGLDYGELSWVCGLALMLRILLGWEYKILDQGVYVGES